MQGERNAHVLREVMRSILADEPLVRVEYVSCADPDTLRELDYIEENALLSMAVYMGKTRLIDNVIVKSGT
jgi:pantoate--beta-alanine ligase